MLKKVGVKCDKCGLREYGSAMLPIKYYKKPCPTCGDTGLITELDLAFWLVLCFLLMITTPINWVWCKVSGGKEVDSCIIVKDGVVLNYTEAEYSSDNLRGAFGRLLEILAEKDLLTAKEIGKIVLDCNFDNNRIEFS